MGRFWLVIILAVAGFLGLWEWEKYRTVVRETQYDPIIRPIAEAEGVDPVLVRSLIWRESRFNPLCRGLAKERGLMQVTPRVAEDWAKATNTPNFDLDDLFKPRTNITVGAWFLARCVHHWKSTDNPVIFGLGEYNAGRTNALRWVDPADPASSLRYLNRIDYPGTRAYIQVIVDKYQEYRLGHFAVGWDTGLGRVYHHLKRLFQGE